MQEEQKVLFSRERFLIAVGYSEEFLEKEAKAEGFSPQIVRFQLPFEALKAILADFVTFSDTADVIMVDTSDATEKKFSPFMKLMEDTSFFFGRVWFYNASLNVYPITILSRCGLYVNPDMGDAVKLFLKEANESETYLKDMLRLKHYAYPIALKMLKAKESFIAFLVGLQHSTPKDYHILAVNEDKAEEFLYLLYEWLMESPIFTPQELQYCKKLRDFKFMKLLGNMSGDKSIEKYVLPYVISYQMSK